MKKILRFLRLGKTMKTCQLSTVWVPVLAPKAMGEMAP